MKSNEKKLPVTVLSGFLGAGKTTLLKNILSNRKGLRVALIVNDMSEINIDATILSSSEVQISRKDEKLVEMSNGCICCTLREDLLTEIENLASQNKYDYLIIESTGISEPMPVAETFFFEDESGKKLSNVARLDTLVTVIDAKNFLNELDEADYLKDRDLQAGDEDTRTIADLLVEQVEFANVLVINKSDLVSKKELESLKSLTRKINSSAKVLTCQHGNLQPDSILNTGLFDIEQTREHDQWMKTPLEAKESETEEFGISSFVYKRRAPFHPERFWQLISNRWEGVVRSKGSFWIASRPDLVGVWSQAGGSCSAYFKGQWFASLPKEDWNFETKEDYEMFQKEWDKTFGDRQQEIVLIGRNMNKESLIRDLDKCLLTSSELSKGSSYWQQMGDRFADEEPILAEA